MGDRFDILRNESASTDKSSEHHCPWSAPHLVSVLVLCLLLYSSLNFALREHRRDKHLCRPQRRVEVIPLRLLKAILVCAHLTPAVTSPCRSFVPRPLPDFIPIFLHSCKIKSGSGLGTRLTISYLLCSLVNQYKFERVKFFAAMF